MSHSPIRIPLRSPQHTALGYRTVFFPFRHTRSTIHIAFRYPTSGHRDALGVSHRDNTDDLIRIANISRRPLLSNGLASSLYSPDFTSATLQGALLVRRDRVNPLTFGRLRFMIFFLVFPSFFPWLYGSDISFNGVFFFISATTAMLRRRRLGARHDRPGFSFLFDCYDFLLAWYHYSLQQKQHRRLGLRQPSALQLATFPPLRQKAPDRLGHYARWPFSRSHGTTKTKDIARVSHIIGSTTTFARFPFVYGDTTAYIIVITSSIPASRAATAATIQKSFRRRLVVFHDWR